MMVSRTEDISGRGLLIAAAVLGLAGHVIASAPQAGHGRAENEPAGGTTVDAVAGGEVMGGVPEAMSAGAPADVATAWGIYAWAMVLAAAIVLAVAWWRQWLRLKDAPARPVAFPPEVGAFLFLGMFVIAVVGVQIAILAGLVPALGEDASAAERMRENAIMSLGNYAGQIVIVLIVWRMYSVATRRIGVVDQRRSVRHAAVLGALALLAVWPIVATAGQVAGAIVTRLTGLELDQVAHDTLKDLSAIDPGLWFFVMTGLVTLMAPICEEVLYRGVVQETLRRLGLPAWWAILATSVVFAAMHFSIAAPHAVASLFVLSLGFGWGYERTGRLTAPIVMHVLFNVANLGLARLLAVP